MEQRDLIKAEIERIGKAIGMVLAKVLGTEGNNLPPDQWEAIIARNLQDGAGLSLSELMDFDEPSLLALAKDKRLTGEQLEQLGDLFAAWAGAELLRETRLLLAQRGMLMFDLSDRISASYSFKRMDKVDKLKRFMQNL